MDIQLELVQQAAQGVRKPISILFLHGMYMGAWVYQQELMPYCSSRGYTTYALSYRGHGQSEGRESVRKSRIEDYMEDFRRTIRRIEGPVVLFGHSFSGMVILKHIETEAVAGAILCSTPTGASILKMQLALLKNYPLLTLRAAVTGNADPLFHDREIARRLFFAGDRSAPSERALNHIAGETGSKNLPLDLMRFKPKPPAHRVPMTMIAGDSDFLYPRPVFATMAKNLGIELQLYPGRPHALLVTPGWQEIADDAMRWIERNV